MSPELFDLETQGHCPTKHSDCYALRMVIYEVLSRNKPFYRFADWVIYGKVFRGDRPERPQGVKGIWFTDEVWGVLGLCWTPQPENRPSIEDVLECLEEVLKSWIPPSPRLFVAPSTDPLIQESSNTISVGSTDASDVSLLSQQSEKLDQESAGIIGQVSLTGPDDIKEASEKSASPPPSLAISDLGPIPKTPHNSGDSSQESTYGMFSLRFPACEKPYVDAKARLQPPQPTAHSDESDLFIEHEPHSPQRPLHDLTASWVDVLINLIVRRDGRSTQILTPGNFCFPPSAAHSQ